MILLPLLMAGLAIAIGCNRWRPWLLPVAGLIQLALLLRVLRDPSLATTSAWLALDAPGRLVLLLVSVLFTFCGFYAVGYLHYRQERPNRAFCACLLGFLGMTSLVAWAQHLGLMWVGIEATALITAPLIYFNHTTRSIEATWKYLLIGSVGIALALLGTFFLAYAALHGGVASSLTFTSLLEGAPSFSKPWLHAAFVLLMVGYGTKMGLAPMHTWKPDAYGEAPGSVGALLAGGLTNCAFLAILRVCHLCRAAGEGAYSSRILIFMGLFSMAMAGVFMVGQKDFKRMLAYSSVEHMGTLVLGLGIGGPAVFGTLLHMVNNGITKGVLFLSAGNIHRAYGSKTTDQVRGALRRLPLSGALFLAGFLAITGSPPFAPFVSEFTILNAAIGSGRYVAAGLFLFLLLLVFIGMGATVLTVVQGTPDETVGNSRYRETWLTGLPPLLLMALVLMLGLWIPAPLRELLTDAVRFLEVAP
jgi:hydrogenase-4 component F